MFWFNCDQGILKHFFPKRLSLVFSALFALKDSCWMEDISDVMVLALISTACISNVICSLQAMLIYVRISIAVEAKDWNPCKYSFTISCIIMFNSAAFVYLSWRWILGPKCEGQKGCTELSTELGLLKKGSKVQMIADSN